MRRATAGFVLGYHGCEAAVADGLVNGELFEISTNDYDWLGSGIYFWENDALRGLQWAEMASQRGKTIKEPAVVGAVIELGLCLDLTQQSSLDVIRTAYFGRKRVSDALREKMPKNIDKLRRPLDCAVLNYLYESMPAPKFQTVRGVFVEGGELFPGAHIEAKTHIQIAVRDPNCIRGVFRVPDAELAALRPPTARPNSKNKKKTKARK